MKELILALEELKNTASVKEKEALLKKYEDLPHFKRVINFLCDDFQIIGISTKKLQNELIAPEAFERSISDLLDYLVINSTGSHLDVSLAKGFLEKYPDERQQLEEIIAKTWVTTVGAKSVNKVYGKYFIPEFNVQLAYSYEKKIDSFSDDDEFVVTQKLDGFRLIVEVKKDLEDDFSILFRSRKGKIIEGLSELENSLKYFMRENSFVWEFIGDGLVFDGEALAISDGLSSVEQFQATSRTLTKKGEKIGIQYHIFDFLSAIEFKLGKSSLTYAERREILDELHPNKFVSILPSLKIIKKEDIGAWAAIAEREGWEGVMLNHLDGKYEGKRSKHLLKVKGMKTADLEVVGFEEAIDGAFKGGLSSIVFKLDDDNTVAVSSGLTLEQRAHIWDNKNDFLGKIAEIQYFEKTKNQNGGTGLRFPVFKGWRFDKTAEDVNLGD